MEPRRSIEHSPIHPFPMRRPMVRPVVVNDDDPSSTRNRARITIGVIGAGDYNDDALGALLERAGYGARVLFLPEADPPLDLIIFRPSGTRRDLERGRALARQRCPIIVLGFPMAQLSEVLVRAQWLSESIDSHTLLQWIRKLLPYPETDWGDEGSKPNLSDREVSAVRLYVDGLTVADVAKKMAVAPSTITTHLVRARAKFAAAGHSVDTKIGLLRCAIKYGYVDCPCPGHGPGHTHQH